MHQNPHFTETDLTILHPLMSQAGLAHLVTATSEGPIATPLPLYLAADEGDQGVIYGHMARQNLQWQTPFTGEALAIFMGSDAYVSPNYYASKSEHHKVVPTWNYQAIHAYGVPEFFDEPERLLDVVTRLTTRHEASQTFPWQVSDAPKDYIDALLRGIVGIRLPISRLLGQMKMSQNKSLADRQAVIKGLSHSQWASDREAARNIAINE